MKMYKVVYEYVQIHYTYLNVCMNINMNTIINKIMNIDHGPWMAVDMSIKYLNMYIHVNMPLHVHVHVLKYMNLSMKMN